FVNIILTGQIDIHFLEDDLYDSQNINNDMLRQAHNTLENYLGFLELHIEQGTVLENNDNKIGVVTSIAGINRTHITVKGEQGHSGTIPMHSRKEAMVMASEIVKHINTELKQYKDGTVATVRQFEVKPNIVTIVSGEVEMNFEVRSGSEKVLTEFPR